MKNGTPETLEEALKEIMRHVRIINELQKTVNEMWGVRMCTGMIPGILGDAQGEINVRRGIEEIEKALGKEAKFDNGYTRLKRLRYYGIEFVQYADDKTKTFVKAFGKPPKVVIVEDGNEA